VSWGIRGLIEGFYGRPWTWDERAEVMRWSHDRGMTHYVHAPKDDPKHREAWRDPYEPDELDGFRRLVDEGTLAVGFGISPGLSMDYRSSDDLGALGAKVDQVLKVGVDLVCLALDDIPFRAGLGEDHVHVTRWLAEHVGGRASLLLVPTEYVGSRTTPYLEALAAGIPEDVPIAWTGMAVMNDVITADEARARADALGGRLPFLWDNFPVNDGMMVDRLHLGPLWGRDAALPRQCSGYLANPMVQPRASKLPLASVAAFLRGEDPVDAWVLEADALGVRVFAEACDGAVPRALVQNLADKAGMPSWVDAALPLASWLSAAGGCGAADLGDEVGPWVDQVHREARVGLDAVRLLQAIRPGVRLDGAGNGRAVAPDPSSAMNHAGALWFRWPRLWRSSESVMGVRLGFRPALGQRPDGTWRYQPDAMLEDQNAIDALCRLALANLAALDDVGPLVVEVDGTRVPLGDDGSFAAEPGAFVTARSGTLATRVRVPFSPPLDDPRFA